MDGLAEWLSGLARGDVEGTRRPLSPCVDVPALVAAVTASCAGAAVTRNDLARLVTEAAVARCFQHPDYGLLAGRAAAATAQNAHPYAGEFSTTMADLHLYVYKGKPAGLVADDVLAFVTAHASTMNAAVHDAARVVDLDMFGYSTLVKSYLLRTRDERGVTTIMETPAIMYMRVAAGLHCGNLDATLETFWALVYRRISHASPTLFNSGTVRPQMSSCFLLGVPEDSIPGIFTAAAQCASIQQYAGGIGLAIHNVRATGSYIRGTNGESNGLVPMLQVFDKTAKFVDQGGGKRKGAIAIYLEPWHPDIFDFLEMRKAHGAEEMRVGTLMSALWVPDLFMRRVVNKQPWSLFCPDAAPGLAMVHGAEFDALYERYEAEGRARRTVNAVDLFNAVLSSIRETGTPYVLFKDTINRRSNHAHLGTIQCSNLCAEIVQFTSPDEIAVCNLGAIVLDECVKAGSPPTFDFAALQSATRILVRNLDRIIDRNFYPVPQAATSNKRHRPIGIGVVGLADAFARMGLAFIDAEAKELNVAIFETMYYAALDESVNLAAALGTYPTYAGSPLSKGLLQFDLAGVTVTDARHDWTGLRARLAAHGARNSLLIAVMPTASTAQIVSRNEGTEPFFSNTYSRHVLAGNYPVVNRHLVEELEAAGVWDDAMRSAIEAARGSVQGVDRVPIDVQRRFLTAFEIPQKHVIDMAAARSPFIDQSESLNLFMADPTWGKLTAALLYAWNSGVKTGLYYLRSKPGAAAVQIARLSSEAAKEASAAATPESTECLSCAV
jgi:ribonucleoside-diphosphate reductase alpha subunit